MERAAETELARRCLDGDEEAWNTFFDAHHAPLVRFAFSFSDRLTAEDAEEIAQETLLAAVRALPTFRGRCALQTWLFRIALNKARDHLERASALRRGGGRATLPLKGGALPGEDGQDRGADPPDPSPPPDRAAALDDDSRLIRETLDRLGPPCDDLLRLRYYAGLDLAEIAAALGLNIKTVSSRLSRCLERLETLLRPIFTGARSLSIPSNL